MTDDKTYSDKFSDLVAVLEKRRNAVIDDWLANDRKNADAAACQIREFNSLIEAVSHAETAAKSWRVARFNPL